MISDILKRKRQTLESWIREALTDPDKEGPCTMMALVHKTASGGDREVHTVKFGPKAWEPRELAQLFQHKADSFSQDLDGTQQFILLAFYNEQNEASASHPFRVGGTLLAGDSELSTDEPNAKGVLAQALRHTESVMQLAWRQSAAATEQLLRSNEILANQNQQLTRQSYEQSEMLVRLLAERDQKTHEHQLELISREERSKLISFAPALINSLTGKQVFPESHQDTAILEMAAEKLSEEQIHQLSAMLPAELWGPIANRLTEIMRKKREAREQTLRLTQGLDPEDDAAGDTGHSNGRS